jgi:asparagine N-glycosylation enzyme membrane subunit Stt3
MKWRKLNLPRVILYLAVVMVAAGIILHGVRLEGFERGWQNLLARPNKNLALRFLVQPAVSIALAIRDGIRDARTGRSPYFWTVVSDPAQRSARLREGIAATGKIFLIAIALDVVYQIIELKAFYPTEALIVAVLLAFIPYLIVRGPAARLARRFQRNKAVEPQT